MTTDAPMGLACMKVVFACRAWPSHERSGVSLAAAGHVLTLAKAGHDVAIVGANRSVLGEHLPVTNRFYVPASGSGAIYSPAQVDRECLRQLLVASEAEIVIVESWQTAIGDATVDVAHSLGLPLLMISHGVSVHPFSNRPKDVLRAAGWIHYRAVWLPRRISRLSGLTALCEQSASRRFFDRDLARGAGIPIYPLANSPVNFTATRLGRLSRKRQIVVVGYFSPVKNQLRALDVVAGLPPDVACLFVGRRAGSYFRACVQRASDLRVADRVRFLEDNECDLATEIGSSLLVLSTSVTEALPITLLEAMACGTPFVATGVGAVPSLRGGLQADDRRAQIDAVRGLINDDGLWTQCSVSGVQHYQAHFTVERTRRQLMDAVMAVARSKARSDS